MVASTKKSKQSKQSKSPAADQEISAGKSTAMKSSAPAGVLSPFDELEQAFNSTLGRFFPHGWLRPMHLEWPRWGELQMPFEGRLPHVDVIDGDNDIVVKAEMPGVDKKDLDVSITESTVTIKGSASYEKDEIKGDYHRREMNRGAFSRTVTLPCDVDGGNAEASFKNGILELTIPKVEKSKRRKIPVH